MTTLISVPVSTETNMNWNTTLVSNNFTKSGTGVLTCQTAGTYLITAETLWDGTLTGGQQVISWFILSGSSQKFAYTDDLTFATFQSTNHGNSMTFIISMTVGQTLTGKLWISGESRSWGSVDVNASTDCDLVLAKIA